MDYVLQILSRLAGSPETGGIIFIAAVAGAVFLLGLGLMSLVIGISDPLRRRLRGVADARPPGQGAAAKVTVALQGLSPYILPSQEAARSKINEKLIQAGFRSPGALTLYYGAKSFGGVLLPILVLLSAPVLFPSLSFNLVLVLVVTAGLMGIRLPKLVVEHIRKKRQLAIRNGLPDAIDLLVVCTEAGLGLNGALQRVADELGISHPEVAAELALVNAELLAGVERSTALKNLAKRTGLEDIKGLVAVLSQSMRFGTSVADSLRIYSEEFRDKRAQKAEEYAAKLAVKMIFPLVFCFMPALYIVILGPTVLNAIEIFKAVGHH